jgi:hypothetical protein
LAHGQAGLVEEDDEAGYRQQLEGYSIHGVSLFVVRLCVCVDVDVLNFIRTNTANVVKRSTATVPQLLKYPYRFSTFVPKSMEVLIEQFADGQPPFGKGL